MVIETLHKGGFKTCFVYMHLILLIVNLGESGKEQKSINLALHSIHTHIHWASYVTAILN